MWKDVFFFYVVELVLMESTTRQNYKGTAVGMKKFGESGSVSGS